MKRTLTAAAVSAAVLLVPAAAVAQDGLGSLQVVTEAVSVPSEGAEVVAVHGVPDEVFDALGADSTDVDVLVNGDVAFTFGYGDTQVVDSLEAGTEYTIEVAPAGSDDAILELGPVTLEDGTSTSVVAHLDGSGDPVLEAYGNETDATGIQVFHTANFGAVDIIAGGEPVLEGVENGATARIDLEGGTTVEGVGVAPAGGDVAIDLGDVEVPADTLVLAYAVGQLPAGGEDDGTDTDTDTDGDMTDDATSGEAHDGAAADGERPTHVAAGEAGLASDAMPAWVAGLMALGALGIAAPVVARVRR
jgi:hypothetical protein